MSPHKAEVALNAPLDPPPGVRRGSWRWGGQKERLAELLQRHSLREALRRLNQEYGTQRSYNAIRRKAWDLGMPRTARFLRTGELARTFGISKHKAFRWMNAGLFELEQVDYQSKRPRGVIPHDAIVAFIETHPYVYDVAVMDRTSPYFPLAQRAQREDPYLTLKEAHVLLGRSPATLRRYVLQGLIPTRLMNGVRSSTHMIRKRDIPALRRLLDERAALARESNRERVRGWRARQLTSQEADDAVA